MSPVRIKRTEDWKPSKTAVWVGPRSKFYNPFAAKIRGGESGLATMTRQYLVDDFRFWLLYPQRLLDGVRLANGAKQTHLGVPYDDRQPILDGLESLRGKDLVCRCHISQPCHADVLLELANKHTNHPNAARRLAA